MATRKPITKKDLIQARREGRDQGYHEGHEEGLREGFIRGDTHGRTEMTKYHKHQRNQTLQRALEQTTQALDAVAHLAAAIAKESL